ncbi:MAG: alpha/beta hydrolase [Calditrichaeota bacterium]|nr:alpha/beta hydrolase [Calditrichota bacterium]
MKNRIKLIFLLFLLISCHNVSKKSEIQTGFAEVNGTTLYYEAAGMGEPIVFVHGNFGDRRHWDFQFGPLSQQFRVMRYDVRGYGKSALPNKYEMYYDRDDLAGLMDFLKIEKAHICGLSMGSGIIVDFALHYPERCLSLIPVGPWAMGYGDDGYRTPASDSFNILFGKVYEKLLNQGPKAATDHWWAGDHPFAKTIRSQATLDSLLKMGYEYSYWGFLNENKRSFTSPPAIGRLNEIHLPTLIVTAEYDFEPCLEIADIMEREIAGSKKISVKDAGHIMNMDKPEEFNAEIIKFINSLKK